MTLVPRPSWDQEGAASGSRDSGGSTRPAWASWAPDRIVGTSSSDT